MAPQKSCKTMMETSGAAACHTRSLQHPTRASDLNQQPDPRSATTPSHVGCSPTANYATEPNTTHTLLKRTVRITHTPSSPTGSGTEALLSILNSASSREAAHPHPPLLQRDPNTPRNYSPIPPSLPKAAKEARAAPRAIALRCPQKHKTTAVFTVFWPASFVSS